MQPKPSADTSRPLLPNVRFCIAVSLLREPRKLQGSGLKAHGSGLAIPKLCGKRYGPVRCRSTRQCKRHACVLAAVRKDVKRQSTALAESPRALTPSAPEHGKRQCAKPAVGAYHGYVLRLEPVAAAPPHDARPDGALPPHRDRQGQQ